MFWWRKAGNYLDTISELLVGLGISKFSQKLSSNGDRLTVHLNTQTGRQFEIIFWMDGEEVVYEAVIRKAPTGGRTIQDLVLFYQTLLTYNSAMPKIHVGMINSNNIWFMILRGGQEYRKLDAKFLVDLLLYYRHAFSTQIPKFEDLAKELEIEFTGILDESIKGFIDDVMS